MNTINLTKDKSIYKLQIDKLMKINNIINFDKPFQSNLFDILKDDYLLLDKNIVDNLNTLLPTGINLVEIKIKELNGNSLFNDIINKQNKLKDLNEEISKLSINNF